MPGRVPVDLGESRTEDSGEGPSETDVNVMVITLLLSDDNGCDVVSVRGGSCICERFADGSVLVLLCG